MHIETYLDYAGVHLKIKQKAKQFGRNGGYLSLRWTKPTKEIMKKIFLGIKSNFCFRFTFSVACQHPHSTFSVLLFFRSWSGYQSPEFH